MNPKQRDQWQCLYNSGVIITFMIITYFRRIFMIFQPWKCAQYVGLAVFAWGAWLVLPGAVLYSQSSKTQTWPCPPPPAAGPVQHTIITATGDGKILFTNFLPSGRSQNYQQSKQLSSHDLTIGYLVAWIFLHFLQLSMHFSVVPRVVFNPTLPAVYKVSPTLCGSAQFFSHNSSYVRLNMQVFVFLCYIRSLSDHTEANISIFH